MAKKKAATEEPRELSIHEKDAELKERKSAKQSKARKLVTCYRCNADIEPGEMHEVSNGGKFRLCEACASVVY